MSKTRFSRRAAFAACAWALILSVASPVAGQTPGACGTHAAQRDGCGPITRPQLGTSSRYSGARATGSAMGAIDVEVLSSVVSTRLREVRQRALRDLIEELAANGATSRPLEDLLEVVLSLVDVSSDGTAIAQSLASALIRDGLSYAIAALTVGGHIDKQGCGGDPANVHRLASAAYEGLAQSRLAFLGFPAASEEIETACRTYASSVAQTVDLIAEIPDVEALARLPDAIPSAADPSVLEGLAVTAIVDCAPYWRPVATAAAQARDQAETALRDAMTSVEERRGELAARQAELASVGTDAVATTRAGRQQAARQQQAQERLRAAQTSFSEAETALARARESLTESEREPSVLLLAESLRDRDRDRDPYRDRDPTRAEVLALCTRATQPPWCRLASGGQRLGELDRHNLIPDAGAPSDTCVGSLRAFQSLTGGVLGLLGEDATPARETLDAALAQIGALITNDEVSDETRARSRSLRVGDFARLAQIIYLMAKAPQDITRQSVIDLTRWLEMALDAAHMDDTLERALRAMLTATANATRERRREDGSSGGLSIELDGGVLVSTFVEEFGEVRRGNFRAFPYANVGYGPLWQTTNEEFRLTGWEELGIGFDWALDPNVILGGHIVVSGLLLSITDSTGPQDVIMVGGGPHFEIYELIVFEAFTGLIIPLQGADPQPTFGISAQIPLYDYFEALADAGD